MSSFSLCMMALFWSFDTHSYRSRVECQLHCKFYFFAGSDPSSGRHSHTAKTEDIGATSPGLRQDIRHDVCAPRRDSESSILRTLWCRSSLRAWGSVFLAVLSAHHCVTCNYAVLLQLQYCDGTSVRGKTWTSARDGAYLTRLTAGASQLCG